MKKLFVSALFFLSIASGLTAEQQNPTIETTGPYKDICIPCHQGKDNKGKTTLYCFNCDGNKNNKPDLTLENQIRASDGSVYVYYSQGRLQSDPTGQAQND